MTTVTRGMIDLPIVSYTKAIDVWTGWCMAFLAASVVETAVIAHFVVKKKGKQNGIEWPNGVTVVYPEQEQEKLPPARSGGMKLRWPCCCQRNVFVLDKVCRYLFPTTFISFTFTYLVVYTRSSS